MKNMNGRKVTRGLLGVLMLGLLPIFATASDVVLDWNEIAVNTAVANGQNPFALARYAAIVQLAVFEAVNAATNDYQPYLGIKAPPGASPEAAAVEAAYAVLSKYFGGAANPTTQSALDAARMNSLMSIPDGQAKIDVIPFGIPRVSDYLLDPPPALTSNKYAKAYNEVMTVGSADSPPRNGPKIALTLCCSTRLPRQLWYSTRLPAKSPWNRGVLCPKMLVL